MTMMMTMMILQNMGNMIMVCKNGDSVIHRLNDLDLYDGNDDNDNLVTKRCYDSDLHDDYAPCYKICNISALEHSFVEKTTPFSTISTTRRKGACTLRSI